MAGSAGCGGDGRGQGIGRGIVLSLADLGFTLVVNYRSDLESAEAACREAETGLAGRRRDPRRCRRPCQGRRLLDTAMERHARLDLWVNNAGIAPEQRLDMLETTPESWDRVLTHELKGPFFLTQAVANAMIGQLAAANAEQPQIVFITSISSLFASVNRGGILCGQGRAEHGRPSSSRCDWPGRGSVCTRSGRG